MKNILFLTDFSDTSKNAIQYALRWFKEEKCNFYVLYIQDSSTYTTDDLYIESSTSLYSSLIGKHQKKLFEYVTNLKSEFKNENYAFHTIVDFDSIVDAINQTIQSKKIDLIVMGTNGATGAKEVVFGSNTINVIRKIDCTTLIIPENFKYILPKEMLLALDPFDTLNGNVIHNFFKFFERHHLRLNVLRVHTDPNVETDDKHRIAHFMKDKKFNYSLISDVPMEYAVDTYLQTNKIDVLSLFVQEETLLERLFIGSSTTHINKEAKYPLLIFHS